MFEIVNIEPLFRVKLYKQDIENFEKDLYEVEEVYFIEEKKENKVLLVNKGKDIDREKRSFLFILWSERFNVEGVIETRKSEVLGERSRNILVINVKEDSNKRIKVLV